MDEDIVHIYMKIWITQINFILLLLKFKLNNITKFSFKSRLFHEKPYNDNDMIDLTISVNKNMLGHYLAGLIEGDGSRIVPVRNRNKTGKLLYPKVKITFVDIDAPLAIKLQEVFGAGTLQYPKNTKYVNLLFQDITSLERISVLINGKMRTPKIEALHRMIDWLNARSTTSNVQSNKPELLSKLGENTGSLRDNPWLTGFIEADGNFYASFNINSQGIAEEIRHYMRISQKAVYSKNSNLLNENNSNKHIMENIRQFLDVKPVNEIKRTKEKYVELAYEVRTSKKSSSGILIAYLSKYPLFSSKHQDFLSWGEIHKIRLSKSYKTLDGTTKLILLKNSMNTLRTQYNWDCLNRFYTI